MTLGGTSRLGEPGRGLVLFQLEPQELQLLPLLQPEQGGGPGQQQQLVHGYPANSFLGTHTASPTHEQNLKIINPVLSTAYVVLTYVFCNNCG